MLPKGRSDPKRLWAQPTRRPTATARSALTGRDNRSTISRKGDGWQPPLRLTPPTVQMALGNRGIGVASPCRISRPGLALLLVILARPSRASWGSEAAPERFRGYYQELQEAAR